MTRRPAPSARVTALPQGIRQRSRADGSIRWWWEPSAAARKLGFDARHLGDGHLTTAIQRTAAALNAEVARARTSGKRDAPAPAGRSIEALIGHYRRSLTFTRLRPKTRASYDANFRLIARKWGLRATRDFTKPIMRAWYETLHSHSGPHAAVALLRAMSILFSHAELIGWRPEGSNPCQRLKLTTPPARSRTATWAEADVLVATADRLGLASVGTAIMLSMLTGQRQTDILAAEVADFTEHAATPARGRKPARGAAPATIWVWSFTRSKRGNAGAVTLHPEVAPRVVTAIAAAQSGRILRDEISGAPYTEDLFGRRFARVRAAAIEADATGALAPLAGLQFRDLRRTFATLARAGGATKDDAADVLGNSAATNPRLGNTYMPAQLATTTRAVAAIRRPANPQR